MESLKNLLNRYKRTGLIFMIGLMVIVYIAFGFVYFQQGPKQAESKAQIDQIRPVLMRPLPSHAELQEEYDRINGILAPMSDKDIIKLLVTIAKDNGINIGEDAGKFQVPAVARRDETVAGIKYKVMYFDNVIVQGKHSDVMDFISSVQSGSYQATMFLKEAVISEIDVQFSGEEGERREEFRKVIDAVKRMMEDNGLHEIPNPISFTGGLATNYMGDDIGTVGIIEGFPDIATSPAEKGYTGNSSDMKSGYVLYEHTKVSVDNTRFETVSYLYYPYTDYYYTCEADGTVRQWDNDDLARATEYFDTSEAAIETRAIVEIDIYTIPQG